MVTAPRHAFLAGPPEDTDDVVTENKRVQQLFIAGKGYRPVVVSIKNIVKDESIDLIFQPHLAREQLALAKLVGADGVVKADACIGAVRGELTDIDRPDFLAKKAKSMFKSAVKMHGLSVIHVFDYQANTMVIVGDKKAAEVLGGQPKALSDSGALPAAAADMEAEYDPLDALRAELQALNNKQLRLRAVADGVDAEAIEDARDKEAPKPALIALVLAQVATDDAANTSTVTSNGAAAHTASADSGLAATVQTAAGAAAMADLTVQTGTVTDASAGATAVQTSASVGGASAAAVSVALCTPKGWSVSHQVQSLRMRACPALAHPAIADRRPARTAQRRARRCPHARPSAPCR